MWSLMCKEWRDYRALMLGFLVLPPLVSLGLRSFVIGWPQVSHTESVVYIVPAFFGLYVVAIAADLIAGDTGSGRIRFLAALPVRPTTVWTSKLIFLVAGSAIYLGYLLAAEWIMLSVANKNLSLFFLDLQQNTPTFVVIVMAGAAVLVGSTLLDRSLSALLAGAAILAAVVAVILLYNPQRFGLHYRKTMLAPAALVLVPAMLFASYLAFTRGRVHLGSRVRRVSLAAIGFLVVATAPALVSARALEAWWHVKPSDTDLRWNVSSLGGVTPDGRWLVATAARSGKGPFGLWPHRGAQFAVRFHDGAIRDLTGEGTCFWVKGTEWYPSRDRLRLVRWERSASLNGQTALIVDYDLDRGRVTRTRVHPRPEELRRFLLPLGPWHVERRWVVDDGQRRRGVLIRRPEGVTLLPAGWDLPHACAPWGVTVYRIHRDHDERRGHQHGVFEFTTGRVRETEHGPRLLPTRPDGEYLSVEKDGRGILAVPVRGGEPRLALEARYRTSSPSPDGTRFVVATDRGLFRFRAAGGDPEAIRSPDGMGTVRTILWSKDSRSFLAVSQGEAWKGTRDGATLTRFGDLGGSRPIWFNGERVVATDVGSKRVVAVDAEGTRQLLPAPD